MKALLLLATVGSLVATLATAAPASAAYPGRNGLIAYSSRPVGGGNPEIVTARADGQFITQLTHNGAAINDTPSYSPDGRYLAFSSSMSGELQIYVMRADGSDLHQVPTGLPFSYDPTWSPDGQQLAFSGATEDDSPRDLYVIGVDGQGLRQLTNDFSDVGIDGISWQPTGGLIAFDSDVTGFMQVYTIRPDGTHRTRLTNGHAYNDQPDFSPDGQTIAYIHTSFHATGTTSGINTIDVATRQITQVTDSATLHDESPAFSPDGRRILFSRLSQNGSTDLNRITLSTGAIAYSIDTMTYNETDPSWQPRCAEQARRAAASCPAALYQMSPRLQPGSAALPSLGRMLIHPWDAATEQAQWVDFVRGQGFGHLVAAGRGRDVPVVVPTQFALVDAGLVLLHFARPNPIWSALDENPTVLLSVAGDWAYVPAAWKAIGAEDPRMGVPTTYYSAVQLIADAAVIDDAEAKAEILRAQLAVTEPDSGAADPSEHGRTLNGIRGLRLAVCEVRAKFKYGGNVDDAHRAAVADHLALRAGPGDAAAAAHLARQLPITD